MSKNAYGNHPPMFGLEVNFESLKPGTLFTFKDVCLTGFKIQNETERQYKEQFVLPTSLVYQVANANMNFTKNCIVTAQPTWAEDRCFLPCVKYYIDYLNHKENKLSDDLRKRYSDGRNHVPAKTYHVCTNLKNSSLIFLGPRVFGMGIASHMNFMKKNEEPVAEKNIYKKTFGEFVDGCGQKIYLDESQIFKIQSMNALIDAFEFE